MNDTKLHQGHCRCGTVKFTSDFSPDFMVYCHCDDCRRATGAPLLASVAFPKDTIVWQGKDAVGYHTVGTASRLFCKICGSPIAQEHDSKSELTFFNTGFMDEPERYAPTAHTFAGEQLNWLKLDDGLPRHKTTILINKEV